MASPSTSSLTSCGLGGEVFGWDVETGARRLAFRGIEQSAYCIASCDGVGNGSGNVLVVGLAGRSKNVVVVDGRSGTVVGVLAGHDGTVRAVVDGGNGGHGENGVVYSGGGDGLVKGWDLRMLDSDAVRGAAGTIGCHRDSVWCLQYGDGRGGEGGVGEAGRCLYSSGRDGFVYRTETRGGSAAGASRLVVDSGEVVTGMCVVGEDVWVGVEASSSVTRYRIGGETGDRGASGASCGTCANVPASTIPGMTTIQKLAPLTDKIHFLAKDRQGNVMLWDVTQAKEVEDLGSVPDSAWGELRAEMFDPTQSALTWFQPESSLGVVAGRLSPGSCFLCESYTKHLGHPDAPNDEKVNVAEVMLKTLFVNWKRGVLSRRGDGEGNGEAKEGNEGAEGAGADPSMTATAAAAAAAANPRTAIFPFADSKDTMVMVSGDHNSLPWKKNCCEMDGTEDVPEWVAKCVLEGVYPVSNRLKMPFVLLPKRGSGLPPMGQTPLTAPRVLEVEKMLDYVIKRLKSKGVECHKELVLYTKGDDVDGKTFTTSPGQVILECDGQVVPSNFTMAAIRQWLWKKPEKLRIEYSVCEGGQRVGLPQISQKVPEH